MRVWAKGIPSKETVTEWVKYYGEEYKDLSYSISLDEYHCTEKKMRESRLALYSLDGGVIYLANSPLGEWIFIVPGSMMDAVFKEVCK